MARRTRQGCAAAALAVLALGAAAGAHAQSGDNDDDERFRQQHRETLLISRAADGRWPDGPSRNAVISQDRQFARVIAFESDATNLVKGDSNGVTDVFAVHRRRPYSLEGEPWRNGSTVLVSRSSSGGRANGPSMGADVAGDREHAPRCVAFVSDATNLVKGDTNRRRDGFVYDLRSRRTTRVSITGGGRQFKGATSEVAVDGTCGRVTFVAEEKGVRRVFLRDLRRNRTASIARGNRDSYDVAITKRTTGGPAAVAFASEATNLHKRDRTPAADVYTRTIGGGIRLISVTRSGKPGNGPSDQPAIGDSARFVAFRTLASDILAGDGNGVSDVARAVPGKPRATIWASRSAAVDRPGNGASARPSIGVAGSPVVFESLATNLQGTVSSDTRFADQNRSGDVFYWNIVSRNVSLQSRASDNGIPNLPQSRRLHTPHSPALNPSIAAIGNYMLFDAAYPLMDLKATDELAPHYKGQETQAAFDSHSVPALRQVYLRYIGPR